VVEVCGVALLARTVVGRWDRRRLEQVVSNLIGNAMKFGHGESISVSVEATANLARLSVRDHGIGIGAKDHDWIFDRFERRRRWSLDQPRLGLWVVRQIVSALHGTVRWKAGWAAAPLSRSSCRARQHVEAVRGKRREDDKGGPQPLTRVPTGVAQLDTILNGASEGRSYIVAGAPGTEDDLREPTCFRHAAAGQALYVTLLAESHARICRIFPACCLRPGGGRRASIHQRVRGAPGRGLKGLTPWSADDQAGRRNAADRRRNHPSRERGAHGDRFKEFINELNILLSLIGCTAILLTNTWPKGNPTPRGRWSTA